jgi:hypothetical protein
MAISIAIAAPVTLFASLAMATDPTVDYLAPILSTGMVGIILIMILFRIKIMPVYVFDNAKLEWERERDNLLLDISELKLALKDSNAIYTTQVIPTLTRVLDAERELVDLRRTERVFATPALRGPNGL